MTRIFSCIVGAFTDIQFHMHMTPRSENVGIHKLQKPETTMKMLKVPAVQKHTFACFVLVGLFEPANQSAECTLVSITSNVKQTHTKAVHDDKVTSI
ncbi:hypothetical protein SFRURICE_009570 [Spodoptera frugiperda]|nr:hypothetical protein SFRURICE_009570 [Spodoptera frugiperda]